ncbi:hypothetical protein CEUSTIGMA_g5353.t1 [Chlamydomonas eustigma]|uniref:Uncharacterized protein n=1 Tax=Chlamydomonas eustigma TaxID=1157962 RepID=A0A250X4C1_9CHLO|nr:hypothetical protein CEUSTIGMA_g5353.t1 [Chlamydomonas eustigma]|eukprot:GAX77911.1 hypothetical protein CEUSTIGMA_g5353.t1 [Chlamydomonas eustigma]
MPKNPKKYLKGTPSQSQQTSESLPSTSLGPLEQIDPFDISQQKKLRLFGHSRPLTGDPGSTRWTAPYYLPLQMQKGIPKVLLTDPWPDVRENQLRRDHAKLLLQLLKDVAPQALTTSQVFQLANSSAERPVFGSEIYVRMLLEHLRLSRMIRAQNDPKEKKIPPGIKEYPLQYYAVPHQQEEYGSAHQIERRRAEAQQVAVVRAIKRLRRRQPPFRIHRRRAYDSAFHHEMGRLELLKLQEMV